MEWLTVGIPCLIVLISGIMIRMWRDKEDIKKRFVWYEDFTYICLECEMFVRESKWGDTKARKNHSCTKGGL